MTLLFLINDGAWLNIVEKWKDKAMRTYYLANLLCHISPCFLNRWSLKLPQSWTWCNLVVSSCIKNYVIVNPSYSFCRMGVCFYQWIWQLKDRSMWMQNSSMQFFVAANPVLKLRKRTSRLKLGRYVSTAQYKNPCCNRSEFPSMFCFIICDHKSSY